MCFEVVFQILIAIFAIFGVFSLAKVVEETWFESDNIAVCLLVNSFEVSNNIEYYLKEIFRKPLSRGGGVVVLIEENMLQRNCTAI